VADAPLSADAKAYASPLVVTKLSARAALREWRAGWRRFLRVGAAPGGGGGGGGDDATRDDPGAETGGTVRGRIGAVAGRELGGVAVRARRAFMRSRRAASSAFICSRMSGSLSMGPFSRTSVWVG
jgi:hypothetical protein